MNVEYVSKGSTVYRPTDSLDTGTLFHSSAGTWEMHLDKEVDIVESTQVIANLGTRYEMRIYANKGSITKNGRTLYVTATGEGGTTDHYRSSLIDITLQADGETLGKIEFVH